MRYFVAFTAAAFGCGGHSGQARDAAVDSTAVDADIDAPTRTLPFPDAAFPGPHLYVARDTTVDGGIMVFQLPLTATATVDYTLQLPNAIAVSVPHAGGLVAGDTAGNISVYGNGLRFNSIPGAVFKNGSATSVGQLAFTSTQDLFAATQGAALYDFTPPFANTTVTSGSITTGLTAAEGLVVDANDNLYVGNVASGNEGQLEVYAPPYTGAPTQTTAIPGAAFRQMAISATQLFVPILADGVFVYTLPITSTSTPAFTITNGMNVPEAVALDADGNLYVCEHGSSSVSVYAPPLSAASTPTVTLSIAATTVPIFGIAIGN